MKQNIFDFYTKGNARLSCIFSTIVGNSVRQSIRKHDMNLILPGIFQLQPERS